MLNSKYPTAGSHNLRLKSGRKPLHPINSFAIDTVPAKTKSKQAPQIEKENQPIYRTSPPIDLCDTSLAQELDAIKKKLERLRLDKEITEKMLEERDSLLEMQMTDLQQRGDYQKQLEIEVDRLYRLNELKSYCMKISPIRSLREKQQVKEMQEPRSEEDEGSTMPSEIELS